MKLNPNKVALTMGVFAGFWHLVWGILVATGIATLLLEFIYSIHFVNNPYIVQPFNITRWVTLVIVTTMVGYGFGYIFSLIWNKIHRS